MDTTLAATYLPAAVLYRFTRRLDDLLVVRAISRSRQNSGTLDVVERVCSFCIHPQRRRHDGFNRTVSVAYRRKARSTQVDVLKVVRTRLRKGGGRGITVAQSAILVGMREPRA